jgi:hypothetical protein
VIQDALYLGIEGCLLTLLVKVFENHLSARLA